MAIGGASLLGASLLAACTREAPTEGAPIDVRVTFGEVGREPGQFSYPRAMAALPATARAGASLVQLYTALIYGGPGLVADIKTSLLGLLRADGFDNLAQAVGADHR